MTMDNIQDKVLKQVEFYFGDANLPRDKFLLGKVQENESGWVPLDIITTFSRMKKLTEDLETVKASLSNASEVIELNEDKTMVRRKNPLPESQETLNRSVYVKGFPSTSTLDDLQDFFNQHSDQVQAIRFRRHPKDKTFKGSVFVEFSTEEEANRFSALNLSYQETPLIIKNKMTYFEEKNAERTGKQRNGNSLLEKFGTGRLLKIMDFPKEGITHSSLKAALDDTLPVAYVDFDYEDDGVWIRFKTPIAETFIQEYSSERPLEIGEHKMSNFHLPTEEEQAKYYDETMKPRKKSNFTRNKNGKRNGHNSSNSTFRTSKRTKTQEEEQEQGGEEVATEN